MIVYRPPGPLIFELNLYREEDGSFKAAFMLHSLESGPAEIGAALIHCGNKIIGMAEDPDGARGLAVSLLAVQQDGD